MLWNSLIKKPVLVMGILMMGLFLYDQFGREEDERFSVFLNPKLMPTSCKSVTVKLTKKTPQSWKLSCNNENLTIEVFKSEKFDDEIKLKTFLYRELANNLSFVAKNSPEDSLSRTFIVRLVIYHPKLTINAVSEGKYVARLKELESPDFIRDHLKATVQVKEIKH